ncbi:Crp/Fnr family transcriptional regulator [Alkalitalea saponilacus]|uniref:cAMP-binding domain of CRP or a regulatory subunit of cAMP-dependent protein kinases n=1 Tax=Alkalitalea saponilacus TaxID=889453 RepID=A0A1T5A1P9_9BACT|nr:Crp/Fnr family transcriptional regulator [Alkalitalea saponilacus]ASB48909.1 Crp/Fnr family transcriptional regulator [Alkalitalea saponilacus]SKB28866.1 cAMP-binding domain of CRP or a regulatory subunit of cAMP-dependent protein kinases [Alkalitalea saponilacus]
MKREHQVKEFERPDLKKYEIFNGLSEEQVQEAITSMQCSAYKRGAIVYNEGSRINGSYIVNSGILKIYKTGFDGKEQIIRFARSGDLIAFRSVISDELACTTAEVIQDATLCYIPGETLTGLIKVNPEFAMDLMKLTCRELGEANKYLTDIAQKTVRERLAEVLLLLMDTFELDDDYTLQISLTREELANMVGTATESVIRLLSEFKADKLIEIQGRRIKLLDIPKLIKIGNVYV